MEEELINKPGNRSCVMCGGRNPTWGCYPYGILCCTKCSGQFRELGTSVCTVKSLLLDEVSEEFLSPFRKGSNALFLEWYHKETDEEITPSFFRTQKAKGFLSFLEAAPQDSRERQEASKTPHGSMQPISPSRRSRSKLQAAAVEDSFSEEEQEEKEQEEKQQNKHKPQSKQNKQSKQQDVEVEKGKRTLKRVPGAISIDSSSEKRMGLFKNTQNEEKKSPSLSSSYSGSVMGSGGEKYSSPTQSDEVVRGSNYVGSAEIPQETITDKIRKGIEKGKKTLLERLKKVQK